MAHDSETVKIDKGTVSGLLGVNNSLAYKVHEIEKHFHNQEMWIGKNGAQADNIWAALNVLTPYGAISGASTWGADANDEALVWGTANTSGALVKMDFHRFLITDLSVDTPYIFRIIYGSGTMADAITAVQYSTVMVQNNPTGNKAGGSPIDIMMPRITIGTDKVWVQVMCATNNATASFFCGGHGYVG
jgi:hypothetical protein